MKRFFIIIIIITMSLMSCSDRSIEPKISKEEKVIQKIELTKEQKELIVKMEKEGFLKMNTELNEAFIDPSLWNSMKYDVKVDFSAVLAIHCGNEKGTQIYWVDIKDMYSGKKLAKYSQSFGFKVY